MLVLVLEKLLGWPRFVVLYVVAGLASTVLETIFGDSVNVGASESLFGLLGAAAVLGFRDLGLPTELVTQLRKGALINLGLNVVASLRPNVDWLAHLGGFLAGGTMVRKSDRGHGLGLALKRANLRTAKRGWPALERVHTWNAGENDHMWRINEQVGYVTMGAEVGWQWVDPDNAGAANEEKLPRLDSNQEPAD